MKTITTKDLTPGIFVKLENGSIFFIDEVSKNEVISTLNGGTKRNYRTDLNDAVNFFNEENATIHYLFPY